MLALRLSCRMPSNSTTTASRGLADFIGGGGGSMLELAITDYSEFPRPLFRPAFITDKWPAVDYLVELISVTGMTPFFFVQVKSTAAALAAGHLHVALPPRKR